MTGITDQPYAGLLDVPRGADGRPGVVTDEANYGRGDGDVAMSAPHLMVVGKTGSGKSRTVLAPNAARWGSRALVVMSSKGDLSELTIRRRSRYGAQYVMDLSGEIRGGQIEGVDLTPVRIDPCAWIETDDEAMEMASLLMQIGDVGAGGDGQGSGDSAFWKSSDLFERLGKTSSPPPAPQRHYTVSETSHDAVRLRRFSLHPSKQ